MKRSKLQDSFDNLFAGDYVEIRWEDSAFPPADGWHEFDPEGGTIEIVTVGRVGCRKKDAVAIVSSFQSAHDSGEPSGVHGVIWIPRVAVRDIWRLHRASG